MKGIDLLDFVNFFLALIYSATYGAGLLALVLCFPFQTKFYAQVCRMFCIIPTADDGTHNSQAVHGSDTHALIGKMMSEKFVD